MPCRVSEPQGRLGTRSGWQGTSRREPRPPLVDWACRSTSSPRPPAGASGNPPRCSLTASATRWLRSEQVAYVGDRLDNDVLPAKAAGMFAVFIRRGPWGHLHARRAEAA
ncbi:MAG: HAD hydrolase-like protein, partial [Acidimicrobiales bacterium]